MAGIYIHIPFCKSKCGYCNFFSVASVRHLVPVIKAVEKEIGLTAGYLRGEEVETIYFGGGTPSLPDASHIESILKKINTFHTLSANPEITIEANPDDLSAEKLDAYIRMGINRVSIGIQSFDEDDLRYLDRRHSRKAATGSLEMLAGATLNSYSADLIYGIPGQDEERHLRNLMTCIDAGVPHISCYSLTVEPKTALDTLIRKGLKPGPREDRFLRHFSLTEKVLTQAGYLHYEISNFAREGHLARHNTHYWFDRKYLGVGPSAHSYNQESRRWNHASIPRYLDGIASGSATEGEEALSETMRCNECIMTRLRTMWGIDLGEFEEAFGKGRLSQLLESAQPYFKLEWLKKEKGRIILTSQGKTVSDHVTASLFQ